MPRTKFQNFIFTLITAAPMCYFMIVYNISLTAPEGLSNEAFYLALTEFPLEFLIVFLLAFFVAGHIAKYLAFRILTPGKDNPAFIILAIQTFTVCTMVALMTLYAAIAQGVQNSQVMVWYIKALCNNFVMAYPLQIFIVGPVARLVFRLIFNRQLKWAPKSGFGARHN